MVEVTEVSADEIDDGVAGTAHLFQERVSKTADVRVTVIGSRVFCVRIDSDLLDWRTDGLPMCAALADLLERKT